MNLQEAVEHLENARDGRFFNIGPTLIDALHIVLKRYFELQYQVFATDPQSEALRRRPDQECK